MFSFLSDIAVPYVLLASALQCPSAPPPEISVREVREPTQYVRTMTADQLTLMSRGEGRAPSSPQSYVQGLGGGRMAISGKMIFSFYGTRDEGCIALKSVAGELKISPVIHIASHFREGTCEYEAVLEHEEKHIAILDNFQDEYLPKFRAELARLASYVRPDGPMPRSQLKPTQERKQDIIGDGIEQYGQTLMQILSQRQYKLDTEEEYARIYNQCAYWSDPYAERPQDRPSQRPVATSHDPRYNQ